MISENITNKALAIDDEANKPAGTEFPISIEVETKARQAILQGQGTLPDSTQGWKDYMSLFSTSAEELARLIPTDGTVGADRQKARAYLVANGICSMGTTRHLLNNVGNRLDLP